MADKRESELSQMIPIWLRCLDENKDSGICSVDSILNGVYRRESIVINPGDKFDTNIKESCLFFVQNASSAWAISGAIIYGNMEGAILHDCPSSGFFNSGKIIDVYRQSELGSIIIKNNSGTLMAVYYFALKLF